MDLIHAKGPTIIALFGLCGGIICEYLGGWDTALHTLVVFMVVDFVTGWIVAGVFKKSNKSEGGALESRASYKGLLRKGVILAVVMIAEHLDRILGADLVRNAVILAYCFNESLSIVENLGLMGVYIPKPLLNAIDSLKEKSEPEENGD